MPQLLLLRHAKAAWDLKRFIDRERPLNARGVHAAQAIGRTMASLGLTPEFVLASPAERSMQTLAHLALAVPAARIESPERLYLAAAGDLLRELRHVPDTIASVLVVGHNPGLYDLARLLRAPAGSAAARRLEGGFPTAALALFVCAAGWRDLGGGTARLVRFLLPREPPEIAAQAAEAPTSVP